MLIVSSKARIKLQFPTNSIILLIKQDNGKEIVVLFYFLCLFDFDFKWGAGIDD